MSYDSKDFVDYLYLNFKEDLEASKNFASHDADDLKNLLQQRDANVKVGVALFGLGRMGTIHLENLVKNPKVQILYIVEGQLDRSLYMKNKWKLLDTNFILPSEDMKVFEDSRVDGIVICTPTQTHENLVLKSIAAEKAILCEKPIAFDYDGINKCYKAAAKVKKPLLCAFNRRFDAGFRNIHDVVLRGEIGTVQVVKTCSRDSPLPSLEYLRTSGGIFHDCAVHDIDLICWVLGEHPVSVSTQAHAFIPEIRELNDYDTVAIVMKFPSGALGIIDLSRNAVYGYDQRLEVFGSKGMLTSTDLGPTGVQRHTSKGITSVPIFHSFASRYHDAYIEESNHFIDVVQGKTPGFTVFTEFQLSVPSSFRNSRFSVMDGVMDT